MQMNLILIWTSLKICLKFIDRLKLKAGLGGFGTLESVLLPNS